MTEELALRAKKVVAVEIDEKLRDLHKETLDIENVKVIYGDFLELDLEKIAEEEFGDEGFKVVANLPYYVTTPIIEKLLLSKVNLISITVMVQKEVAKRLAAQPGNKDYGSLSVFINYYTDCKYKFQVPSSVFMPKPNVDSAVVSLLTNSMQVEGSASDSEIIQAVEKAGYGAKTAGSSKKDTTSMEEDQLKDTQTPILRKRLIVSLVLLIPLMYISMGHLMWDWPLPSFLIGYPPPKQIILPSPEL